jgi:dTDP-4-dehydrorhamnose reductase
VGANGAIGSALFARLQADPALNVWGTTYKEELSSQLFHLNLADPPSAWQFPAIHFDVVYLCAGICRMALCERDPAGTHQVNVIGMQALVEVLAKRGAFIVYLSTNQVFSGDTAFVSTKAPTQPVNEYGRQKAQMEDVLLTSYAECSAILRLTKVVEPHMPMIEDWIAQLILQQPVTAFQDMMLAPVSLRQVLDVLMVLGLKRSAGIYHLSGAEDMSYLQLASFLAQQLKRPLSLIQAVRALEKGIQKSFLPRFTTLDCSSTIARCAQLPMHFSEVMRECFDLPA